MLLERVAGAFGEEVRYDDWRMVVMQNLSAVMFKPSGFGGRGGWRIARVDSLRSLTRG